MSRTACDRCGRGLDPRELLLEKLCEECFNSLLSSRDETLSEYLEALGRPAALLSSNLTVLFANFKFCKALMIFPHDIVGRMIGEVLNCVYTSTPGSCGETVSCSLCDLKKLIELSQKEERSIYTQVDYLRKPGILMRMEIIVKKAGEAILFMTRERE